MSSLRKTRESPQVSEKPGSPQVSENPESPQEHENGGDSNDLVNDVLGGTGTWRTVPGCRQRMRCAVGRGLHLASAFLWPVRQCFRLGLDLMVTETVRSLRNRYAY